MPSSAPVFYAYVPFLFFYLFYLSPHSSIPSKSFPSFPFPSPPFPRPFFPSLPHSFPSPNLASVSGGRELRVGALLTLVRLVPEDADEPPGDSRSTVSVFRRFLDKAALAKSLDDPCGDPCGVAIGVAAVRVMTGAGGGHGGSPAGGGPPWRGGKAAGAVDGCCWGGWKDSRST